MCIYHVQPDVLSIAEWLILDNLKLSYLTQLSFWWECLTATLHSFQEYNNHCILLFLSLFSPYCIDFLNLFLLSNCDHMSFDQSLLIPLYLLTTPSPGNQHHVFYFCEVNVFSCWHHRISEIMWYFFFCFWLTSYNMSSMFLHVIRNDRILLFYG